MGGTHRSLREPNTHKQTVLCVCRPSLLPHCSAPGSVLKIIPLEKTTHFLCWIFLPRLVSGLSFKLNSSSLRAAAKNTSFPQRLENFQDDFTSLQEVFLLLSGSCAPSIVSWPHSGSARCQFRRIEHKQCVGPEDR